MPGRRDWSQLVTNLDKQSGLVPGWALAIGIGLLVTAQPALVGVGGVITFASSLLLVKRILPAKRLTGVETHGKKLSISDLLRINPPLFSLGVIGDTLAGKTTLVNRIIQQSTPKERTQGVTAIIASLHMHPLTQIALIDGGGEEFAQQFEVAEYAQLLCILIDHNSSSKDQNIDPSRVDESIEFQRQLRGHLSYKKCLQKPIVWIVLNKRDLWGKLAKPEREKFSNRSPDWNELRTGLALAMGF